MKKQILVYLGIGLICFALTGCGGTTGTISGDTAQGTESVNAEDGANNEDADGADGAENIDDENAPAGGAPNGENTNGENQGNPPDGEKPDGEAPNGEAPNGEAPNGEETGNPPDGQAPDGEAPGNPPDGEKPDGEAPGNPPDGAPGGFGGTGQSSADIDYEAATTITAAMESDGQTYETEIADESALLISTNEEVTISNATVTKTGDSDGGDNCNFYGLNAAVLVKDGSTTTITGATITSDADGANGVFSYGGNGGKNGADGDGTTVNISDSTITTTGDGSGGIMTTGGGVTNAKNLTIETSGRSSAAIRTDRGGGTVTVDGGEYTTNGLGSPAIYSTADITVSNATLTSTQSEGVCIEGMNSITLSDCDMTVENTNMNGNATFLDSIMIYQSMSGDADSGTSTFSMSGGSLTSKNGHVFHVTNTNAVINLSDVTIKNFDSEDILMSVCDDGWNGAGNVATVNADNQELSGTILVGDNSELTLNLTNGSTFKGSISGEITNAKGETVSTEVGTVAVSIDTDSTWTLTEDTYIISFDGDASSVVTNGHTLYVNGTALEGTN